MTLTAPLPMPADEWLDFIETILVYKLPQLTREEIKEMIGLQDIDLKQTRVYQDALGEGRQEGELTIVQRLLERHFGPLPNTITERLRRLDAAQLEALSDVLLDLRSLNELNDWLLAR